jgi:hypothetical protein
MTEEEYNHYHEAIEYLREQEQEHETELPKNIL